MSVALERREAEAPAAAASASGVLGRRVSAVLLGALLAAVAAAVLAGGGSTDGPLTWIGAAALILAAAPVAAATMGRIPWPRPTRLGAASVALFAAFVSWNAVSVVWSVAPDRSWSYFNRGLVYFAFLVAGLFVGALVRRAPTRFALGFALVVAAALAWALAGKIVPSLFPDGARLARLREPVGYWNALALLFALAVPLALWLGGEERYRRALRVAALVFLYALIVGLLLTYSRAGLLVMVAAICAWLVVGSPRSAAILALAVAAPSAIAVSLWAFGQPGIAADGQEYATRVADGSEFAVVLALGALVVAGVGALASRASVHRRLARFPRRLGPRARVGLAAAAFAALVVAVAAASPIELVKAQAAEFANPQTELVTNDPSRFTSLSSNNRWDWWQEAWSAFRMEPITGTGAGSFATVHRLLRDDPITVTEPHSVALQFLSETGIVGALLASGAAGAAVLAAAGGVRRLRSDERRAAAALSVGLGVYLLHSLVEWDWDFVAVNAPVFAGVGVVLAAGRQPTEGRARPLSALAVWLVLVVLLASLAAPWLADERVDEAYAAMSDGEVAAALDAADDAVSLNPLAVEPLVARAAAEIAAGDEAGARASLVRAVEVQPLNPDGWYELGVLELDTGRENEARRYLQRSYELDKYGPAGPLLADLPG